MDSAMTILSPVTIPTDQLSAALSVLPSQTWVMTSSHEQKRGGIIIGRVMPVSEQPALLCVAAPKGHRLATLIRDSRTFGVNLVERTQRLIMRKFDPNATADGDPFDALEVVKLHSWAPILARSLVAFDCEVVRHFDLEGDSELYVGQIMGVRVSPQIAAGLHTKSDGATAPGRDAMTNNGHPPESSVPGAMPGRGVGDVGETPREPSAA
jgi:flavin reductase (DIM6/NTAB) family NADH-FMN oxidoreductase RutF